MKFLIISRPKENLPDVLPGHGGLGEVSAYYQKYIEDGTIDVFYTFPAGGGMSITNADTAERLWEILHEHPLYLAFRWETMILSDPGYVLGNYDRVMAQAQAKN